MEILKNFVVFEGLDGSGTSSQLNILSDFFHHHQKPLPALHKTFEPTDGCIGKLIRSALRRELVLHPDTVAMLFAADRSEHLYGSGGIIDLCKGGTLVVCDRYVLSSLVYQGISCGEELPARLNAAFPGPQMLLFFDVDPETAEKRMADRDIKEIYEYLDFQVLVRRRYKELLPSLARQGILVETIDACPPPQEVARQVWSALEKLPILKA